MTVSETRRRSIGLLDIEYRPKVGNVEVCENNTLDHEFSKFVCVWLLKKGVPANMLPEFFKARPFSFKNLETMLKKNKTKDKPWVVTEARFKDGRRADIFVLDTGERIEIETGKSYEKPEKNNIVVRL